MDLWIRSKSKLGLYKIDNLHCDCGDITTYIHNITYKLGSYSSKRALEVLDEIQEKLMMCIKANGNEHIVGTSCYVYEMPQE